MLHDIFKIIQNAKDVQFPLEEKKRKNSQRRSHSVDQNSFCPTNQLID